MILNVVFKYVINQQIKAKIYYLICFLGSVLEPDDSKCAFPYGLEFLQFLRKEYGDYFNIATGGYPIGHPTAADPIKDISYLKRKVRNKTNRFRFLYNE